MSVREPLSPVRQIAVAAWAVSGVALLLVEGILRLGARAVTTVAGGLDLRQALALASVAALFCYVEGYRGLQCRFVPSVVARAVDAGGRATGCFAVVAAPLYALSLVGTGRRELARAWFGVGLIVLAVIIVRSLPPPWRGIIDAGVSAALVWGLVALLASFGAAVRGSRTWIPEMVSQLKTPAGEKEIIP